MVFPDATALAAAAQVIEDAYGAFSFMAVIFGVIVIARLAPLGIRLFKRAFGGG